MAIYHLSAKCIQRSKGRSATASAAYRSGEKIHDNRDGITHDYTKKEGVVHSEIVTPTGEEISRSELWNLAESSERRKDATTAKEFEVALPSELTTDQRKELVREFAIHISKMQGCAVDIAIHAPGKGDFRNHHAHLLCTTRDFQPGGSLGNKCAMELSDRDRKKRGLPGRRSDLEELREVWATLGNQALTRAGHVADLDHRSNQTRGVDTPPGVHLGPTAAAMERRGIRTERGDRQREAVEGQKAVRKLDLTIEVSEQGGNALERIRERRIERAEKAEQERRRNIEKQLEVNREKRRNEQRDRGGLSR